MSLFSDSTKLTDVPLDCEAPSASLGVRSGGSGLAGGLSSGVTLGGTVLLLLSSLLPCSCVRGYGRLWR